MSGTSTGLQLKLFTFHSLREQSEPQHGLQEQRLRERERWKDIFVDPEEERAGVIQN